ncbi:MAG: sulfite exporter TauE/SafE family protein [Myxococcota bacterium]
MLDVEALPLESLEFVILAVAALATSVLSAVIGMAGGITLLAVMLLFMEPLVAIPLHGVVQLVSNSSRAVIQRKHLRWEIIGRYSLLLLPMGFAGLPLARALPPELTRALIGVFVLLATWAPGWLLLGTHPERTNQRLRFISLGGVVGALNVTVGATGPLIAPFFLNLGLSRFSLVGTKAACQSLGHMAKIVVFGVGGFAFGAYASPLLVLAVMVVSGTWIGSRLLHRVDELWFTRLYKLVLSIIALHLVGRAGLGL